MADALNFQAVMNEGLALHRAGKFFEAQAVYRRALVIAPNSPDALHFCGLAMYQQGDAAGGAELMSRALQLQPGMAEAHSNLGLAQMALRRLDAAIHSLLMSIALKPVYAETYNNLSNALDKKGLLADAILMGCRAVELKPAFPEAQYNLGNYLVRAGRTAEAVECYRRAINERKNYPDAYLNMANALRVLNRLEEAGGAFAAAIAQKPDYPEAVKGMATIYDAQGKKELAAEWYRRALALRPDWLEVQYCLASVSNQPPPPAAPADYITHLFDQYADSFDAHLVGKLEYHGPQQLYEALQPFIEDARDWDIVDLGCGTGLCGLLFKPLARRLTGVDLSSKMLEKARERGIYDALLHADIVAAMHALVRDNALTNLITAADVFIYTGDLAPVLAAAAMLLVPGGLLAFTVEAYDGPDDYVLLSTRRFAHRPQYVETVASAAGLTRLSRKRVIIRKQKGQEIAGDVWVLRKR